MHVRAGSKLRAFLFEALAESKQFKCQGPMSVREKTQLNLISDKIHPHFTLMGPDLLVGWGALGSVIERETK
jgi:hypothetical protein